MAVVYKPRSGISMSHYVTLKPHFKWVLRCIDISTHTRAQANTCGHAVVCADYLTVYTTTSASDVFRPIYRMECAWELDTLLYELLVL